MNESDRDDLERLKLERDELERQLSEQRRRVAELQAQLAAAEAEVDKVAAAEVGTWDPDREMDWLAIDEAFATQVETIDVEAERRTAREEADRGELTADQLRQFEEYLDALQGAFDEWTRLQAIRRDLGLSDT